jgi:hypothetical protein
VTPWWLFLAESSRWLLGVAALAVLYAAIQRTENAR